MAASSAIKGRTHTARVRSMGQLIGRFINSFNGCTRSGYRWRFKRFAQYLGCRPNEVAKAVLRLVEMPAGEAKPKAIAFLPWLRSRGYAMRSGGSGKHGITRFFRHLSKQGLVRWQILYPKSERQEEAWARCTPAFKRLSDQWLKLLRSSSLLPGTVSKHRTHLLHFGLFLRSERLGLGQVTYSHVMRWLSRLRHAGVRPGTVTVRLGTARRFVRFLRISGHVKGNPFAGIGPIRLPTRVPRHLTEQEAVRVVRKARGTQDRAVVTLLYLTGCRSRELTRLNMADMSLRHRSVSFQGPYGTKARTIPLGPEGYTPLRELVLERVNSKWPSAPESPLFLNSLGRRLSVPMLQRLVARLGRRAGVSRHLVPQVLRHTFGAVFSGNGGDLMTLRCALGLGTLAAAQTYQRLAVGRLRVIYEKTHPRK